MQGRRRALQRAAGALRSAAPRAPVAVIHEGLLHVVVDVELQEDLPAGPRQRWSAAGRGGLLRCHARGVAARAASTGHGWAHQVQSLRHVVVQAAAPSTQHCQEGTVQAVTCSASQGAHACSAWLIPAPTASAQPQRCRPCAAEPGVQVHAKLEGEPWSGSMARACAWQSMESSWRSAPH